MTVASTQNTAFPSTASLDRQGDLVVPRGGFSQGVYPGLAELLDGMSKFNARFIYHEHTEVHDAIALWAASTYFMPRWMYHPRLYISSPQASTGKSQQAEVIQYLSNNGEMPSNVSPAYIWGRVNDTQGQVTIMVDEADNIWAKGKETTDLQGILNGGHKFGAQVGRAHASDTGVSAKMYDSYCPVGIIGIKNSMIPQTLMSRCICVAMQLAPSDVKLEMFDSWDHEEYLAYLKEELAKVEVPLRRKDITAPAHLGMRAFRQVWLPLFVLADLAGGDWPDRVMRASEIMAGTTEGTLSNNTKVLLASFDYFNSTNDDKAQPRELADYISQRDDLWQMDAQRLSYYLKTYNLSSRASSGKNYFYREDVMEAAKTWQSDYYAQNLRGHTIPENPPLGTTSPHYLDPNNVSTADERLEAKPVRPLETEYVEPGMNWAHQQGAPAQVEWQRAQRRKAEQQLTEWIANHTEPGQGESSEQLWNAFANWNDQTNGWGQYQYRLDEFRNELTRRGIDYNNPVRLTHGVLNKKESSNE